MAKMTILLVDDEPDFLEIMGGRIKNWGYNLIEASGGKEAVDAVKNLKPDAVILDYMMPDMDGVATLKEIRRFNKEVPVIMFTAYPTEKAMKSTKEMGISAFIPKLSTYTNVQASLRSALDMIEKQKEG